MHAHTLNKSLTNGEANEINFYENEMCCYCAIMKKKLFCINVVIL